MTDIEGINQDLADILDEVEATQGVRPAFIKWTLHEGDECRLYRINERFSKLVTSESETEIIDFFWVDVNPEEEVSD